MIKKLPDRSYPIDEAVNLIAHKLDEIIDWINEQEGKQ